MTERTRHLIIIGVLAVANIAAVLGNAYAHKLNRDLIAINDRLLATCTPTTKASLR